MSGAATARLVPTRLLLVAAVLLVVLVIRAQIVLAPAPPMHLVTGAGAAAATAPAAQASSNSAAVSEQTIRAIGSSNPLSPPRPATQPPASETKPAPGSVRCPSHPTSGLPCTIP